MLAFLSDEWIAALDEAAQRDPALGGLLRDVRLVIEQAVATAGEVVRYHVAIGDDGVHVRPGPAEAPTIRFSQDRETAAAIAAGELSAQRAFMAGRLRVGGDLSVLLAHADVLAQLQDAFGTVRAQTDLAAGRA